MSIANTTIVIPTHYRHELLSRVLKYYADVDVTVLVADSTKDKFLGEVPKNCQYFHYPDMSFYKKMISIVSKVTSKYSVMCADDDFISPRAIENCEQFLEENEAYSSAQGNYIVFKFGRHNKLRSYPTWLETFNYHVEEKQVDERLKKHFKNYLQLFYSVHKTEMLRSFFQDLEDFPAQFNGFLIEYALTLYALSSGKNKCLPIFYSARQLILSSGGRSNSSILDLYTDESGLKDIKLITGICTKRLQLNGVPEESHQQIMQSTFGKIAEVCRDQKKSGNYKRWRSRAFRKVEEFIPYKVETFLRSFLAGPSPFETIKGHKGFPYGSDDQAAEEWKKMVHFILSFETPK